MKQIYFHPGQRYWDIVGAHTSVLCCSRRWGKSYVVAKKIIDNVLEMPRSTGVYVASSFRQAHSRTLPAALMALEDFGWKRDIHYVIGHKPPAHLGFQSPIFQPSDLKDVVWFGNGSIMVIVSQDVPLGSNSMTIDWAIGDEAKGLNWDKIQSELIPALGGTKRYFGNPEKYPHHHGILFCSDMPASKEGSWMFKYESQCDQDLVQCIMRLQAEKFKLMQRPDTYATYIKQIQKKINLLQSKCTLYMERPIFDNIDVIGVDYVKQMELNLTPAVFRTSILSKKIDKVEGGFYPNFSETVNTYRANNNDIIDNDGWKPSEWDCLVDGDVDLNAPIAISFDYNANIHWMVAGQIQAHQLKVLKSFYQKYDRNIRNLIDKFCHYYARHKSKELIYYYNTEAVGNNFVEYGHDIKDIVIEQFQANGWRVKGIYLGTPMAHDKKHLLINDAFIGGQSLIPTLNADNNEEMIQAILLAETIITDKGFKKNKSGEKTLETKDSLPLELRTDATDCFDILVIGCLTYPYDTGGFIYA